MLSKLKELKIQVLGDEIISKFDSVQKISSKDIWYEEFLDYKIVIGEISSNKDTIEMINTYSGGHSSVIITRDKAEALTRWRRLFQKAKY